MSRKCRLGKQSDERRSVAPPALLVPLLVPLPRLAPAAALPLVHTAEGIGRRGEAWRLLRRRRLLLLRRRRRRLPWRRRRRGWGWGGPGSRRKWRRRRRWRRRRQRWRRRRRRRRGRGRRRGVGPRCRRALGVSAAQLGVGCERGGDALMRLQQRREAEEEGGGSLRGLARGRT